MPYAKAEAAKTLEVTGAAPSFPWWLVGLGLGAVVVVLIAVSLQKT